MPRRQFLADLGNAQNTTLPPGISNVKAGDDDGQIEFLYTSQSDGSGAQPIRITALIPELSEYPKAHDFMLFSDENTPLHEAAKLESVKGTSRATVYELLKTVSETLRATPKEVGGDSQMTDAVDPNDSQGSEDDEFDIYDSDHEVFGQSTVVSNAASITPGQAPKQCSSTPFFRNRIRADLREAIAAGFHVGCIGHLFEGYNSYVSVSVRIAKLGISEEAMQAWQLQPSDYLMLIIQYPNGYKTNEELQACNPQRVSASVGMRVVASKSFKPTLSDAIKAFSTIATDRRDVAMLSDIPGPTDAASTDCSIRDTFISKPLAGLLNERLVTILRFRSAGMTWQGAEAWYQQQLNLTIDSISNAVPDSHFEPEVSTRSFPSIVNADHYSLTRGPHHSFPLVAMQFLLRHFVRCTEFCLVCHQKLNTDIEAIKPYVCEQSLCLYQYMALGFGPSIEHEILSQPLVVDLLVSFAYVSAATRKLVDLPDGLSLKVPYCQRPQITPAYNGFSNRTPTPNPPGLQDVKTYEVGFDPNGLELIFHEKLEHCPVRKGTWIVLSTKAEGKEFHCRVADADLYPTIRINEPVIITLPLSSANDHPYVTAESTLSKAIGAIKSKDSTPRWERASFHIYDRDFEKLENDGKCAVICQLLDTLPSIKEMSDYLTTRRPADLRSWSERISPSALNTLRWVIASNRACIMQVKEQDRVSGMNGYMQFRFAMGAPDKEQRFLSEVRNTATRLKLQYPTIFAWHGSPLANWHMIIREGLHFKNADHGRAYGNGVYHAKDCGTSIGYSCGHGGVLLPRYQEWTRSTLRVSAALALNEIVNARAEFVSSNPYYVVQHLDWIQTRYLFVRCAPLTPSAPTSNTSPELDLPENLPAIQYPQDPAATPKGAVGSIAIPAYAIRSAHPGLPKRGHKGSVKRTNPLKKFKIGGGASTPILIDDDDESDDVDSVVTDVEDRQLLIDELVETRTDMGVSSSAAGNGKSSTLQTAGTDFKPGMLDFETLPIMPMPSYATSATTKNLMREMQSLRKVQEQTPLAELGWFIDIERIENVYQWVVELHSFHTFEVKKKPLPLAQDMKTKGINSIVLEVRFNKDFPYTPPYVRVVRPRFLTLVQGGGGHIVQGGAMCMELLTNTGWSSVSSMESVLMQIRLAIASEPFARLDMNTKGDYNAGDAAAGYLRAAQTHGWQVPPGFSEMANTRPAYR